MDLLDGSNPPGWAEAEAGIAYVDTAVAELQLLKDELPRMVHMRWYSKAADEFAEVLHQHVSDIGRIVAELGIAAEALVSYRDDLAAFSRESG